MISVKRDREKGGSFFMLFKGTFSAERDFVGGGWGVQLLDLGIIHGVLLLDAFLAGGITTQSRTGKVR